MPPPRAKAPALLPALALGALVLLACPRPVPEGPEVIDCAALLRRAELGRILARDCEAEAEFSVPTGGLLPRELPGSATSAQPNLDRALAEARERLGLLNEEARELCERFNRCDLPDPEYRSGRATLAAGAKAVRLLAGRALSDVGPQAAASRRALADFLAKDAAASGGGARRPGSCPPHFPEDCGDGTCAPPAATCCGEGLSCPAGTLCCGSSCCAPGAACGLDGTCEGGAFALGCGGGYPVSCPDGACAPPGADCCGGGTFCRGGECCGAVCCGGDERCESGRCVERDAGRSEGAGSVGAAACSGTAPLTCPDGTCAPANAHCCGGGKICRTGTCCGESECCSSGQACEGGRCVGPVAPSAACDAGFPLTCPDGSCAPGGGACCGGAKFCPEGLSCCGESECCVHGEVCLDGSCVGGAGGGGCSGELPLTCPDGTCAPRGADCCDNGKFCRTGACCGPDECCSGGSVCRDGSCVGGSAGGGKVTPCGADMPLRCPDGTCAPAGAACCGSSKFCRRGTCCGEDDCCQAGEICAAGHCVKGGDASWEPEPGEDPAATL